MNFIRKIFEGTTDESVHKQFTRYGKGTYENRALITITKTKNLTKIKTSFEFAGELALSLAEHLQGKTRVTGGVITTKDIKNELPFTPAGQKQFAGVKTYLLDTDMDKQAINDLFKNFSQALILLSFKTEQGELKTKVKSPTSAKPGKSGDKRPKADFCALSTTTNNISEDLAFDIKEEYHLLEISHTYTITSLSVPKEYERGLEQSRLHAKRRGTILRKVFVDGKEHTDQHDFED
ncbi:MAG TPA: hypothetical protein VFE88_02655 [Candidatus Nanoarchaeia archaeon]|nr:hypothetical protein [Candidatus Nanoarchaeia archaeon]